MRMTREAEEAAEAERQREAQAEEERKAAAEAERLALIASMPPEPAPTDEGVVNISFRLPNAKKVARRFLDSQPLSLVQRYLQSLEDMEALGTRYRILSNFPRKVHEDPQATIASMKLGKNIQLIVEAQQEDEEDETMN